MSLRQSGSNSKLLILLLFIAFYSFGSIVSAKPAWKDGGSSDQPNASSGKGGGKPKTTTSISDITITDYPDSLSIISGEKATFTVSAMSSDEQEISYQWYFNGSVINNATTASFSIESVSVADQGEYSVSLSTADITKNAQASLLVEVAPDPVVAVAISMHPVSQAAYVQESLTFNVSATGSGVLNYQWRKNGVALSGQVNSHLSFQSLSLDDTAQYDVVITNEAGSVTSNSAMLTVQPWATIALDWDTPTFREDGSILELSEINSYKLYISYENEFVDTISVSGTMNNFELHEMPPGTYQIAIATTDSAGLTGNKSETITLVIN